MRDGRFENIGTAGLAGLSVITQAEYNIVLLFLVRIYCFVTKACTRRPGAAASVEHRRRDRHTLLAGAAGEQTTVTRLR